MWKDGENWSSSFWVKVGEKMKIVLRLGRNFTIFVPLAYWHSETDWNITIFTARRYAKCGICRRRVSVCLSFTLRYCIKTAKHRIMQIMPHDSHVFWHQSSWRNSKGITPYGSDKCRWGGLKLATFDEKCASRIDVYLQESLPEYSCMGAEDLTASEWQRLK